MATDWRRIKKEYEAGARGIDSLAGLYGVQPAAISRRARKEKWKSPAVKGHAKAGRVRAAEKSPEQMADAHRRLWKGVKKRLVKGLRANDLKLGLEELKLAKMAGEALTSVIKGEREAWGFEEGSDGAPEGAGEIAAEMASLTVPSRAGEAVDGE